MAAAAAGALESLEEGPGKKIEFGLWPKFQKHYL